ncbi:MAG: hypothetical protein ACD_37C00675G0002 [uncultured bacterium]|nr:MAG: hypothetical protein ACD_37C00675G0002 [uncultured bacterium]OGH14748.1 MAG: hypothetical protein A2687_02755 [Candidatus Levybacteria bacterium RIFCSPHIGHO2_01_FULL_38_26]
MSIEYAGLPRETILRLIYPDYAGHLRRTKIHNNGQHKSERNKQRVIEHKLKRKRDISSSNHRIVDSTLRPVTLEGLRECLPKVGVIFCIKTSTNDNVDPLGR